MVLYFIISPKSDNFLFLHTTWSFILLNNTHTFLLSALCFATANAWQNCPLHFLFPVDLPALKETILKQCEIWSSWDEMSSQQAMLGAGAKQTLTGKGLPAALCRHPGTHRQAAVRAPLLQIATRGALSLPSLPWERTGMERLWKIQWGFVESL